VLLLAATCRKMIVDALDKSGIDSVTAAQYQLDDRKFLACPDAILDAINFAGNQDYEAVDLLSFSLGAILATDALFARRLREQLSLPPMSIDNWISIGFPYDLYRWASPDYFENRQSPGVDFRKWINVVVQDDFLGTAFTGGDGRGIRVRDSAQLWAPAQSVMFSPRKRVTSNNWDYLVARRREVNHRVYWDDEDAHAATCFSSFIDQAGWTASVRAMLANTAKT
jgi:hypothetical protein